MIFYEQPNAPWTEFDFKLLEAYQILQDETCPSCGNPIWVCRTENRDVRFKMQSSTCFADKEQENWEKQKKKVNKDWKPAAGEQWYPVPVTISGGPLPTREDYHRELADRMEG